MENPGPKQKVEHEIVGFVPTRLEAEVVDLRRDILEREAVRDFIRGEAQRYAALLADLDRQLFEARMKLTPHQTMKIDKSKMYLLEDRRGTHEG